LSGAVLLLDYNAGVRRRTQGGRKPPVEHKGRSPLEHVAYAVCTGNGGLVIPVAFMIRGNGKVTTGITGLWRPSDRSDAAF